MSALRTLTDVKAAGAALGASMPPFTDAQADRIAALLAPYWPAAQPQAA